MVYVTDLWLPIVLSAVAVFVVSFVVHMMLPYHKSDYKKLPNEDIVTEALRKAAPAPGTYFFPHCGSHKEMNSPEVVEKFKRGPVGLMTVMPSGMPVLAKHLIQWFLYSLAVSVFVAYLTGRTVAPGAEYLAVFRVAGTAGFLAYAVGHVHASIWKGEAWGTTLKFLFDGLLYGLFTAGVFGWLWPR
jgi:hypothetical protein